MFTGQMAILRTTLLAFTLLLALMPVNARADDVDPFGFSEEDYSSWGIVDAPYPFEGYDKDGNYIGYGCFPVGNGLVFAHLGVDGDFNTLRGITGPGYQTRDEDGKPVWWQDGEWPDIQVKFVETKDVPGYSGTFDMRWYRYDVEIIREFTDWSRQSIQQLRALPVVRTEISNGQQTVYSLTYAVPEERVVCREFVFVGFDCVPQIKLEIAAEGHQHYIEAHSGGKHMLINAPGRAYDNRNYSSALENTWIVPVERFPFKDGDTIRTMTWGAIILRFTAGEYLKQEAPPAAFAPDAVFEYRRQAIEYWKSWSAKNRQFDTGNKRLDDMLIQIPVIIETQRDAYSGGVSPLVSYHGYWVRDHNGPILTYLANGRFEEVMRMLRYYRAACLHYRNCSMLVPLDLDLSDLPGWQPETQVGGSAGVSPAKEQDNGRDARATADVGAGLQPAQGGSETRPYDRTAGDLSRIGTAPQDWDGVTVEQAEVPSLIVLQHYWLWREMCFAGRGDEADAFIREAWPFIAHNLFGMQFDADFGVRFHGDETFTHGSLYSTYDRAESGQIGYPNGYIPTEYFSFDNTLLHVAACHGAYLMAERLFCNEPKPHGLDGRPEILIRIGELCGSAKSSLDNYRSLRCCVPAISEATYQPWPAPFANMSLGPWSLPVEGASIYSEQYTEARDQLHCPPAWRAAGEPALRWWTTPWSGYATGHSLGGWLNAARINHDADACVELVDQLLLTASPEGAWCEVLSPDGFPVDIYGRTNRIRPWESGINYVMLAAYLAEKNQLAEQSAGQREQLLSLAHATTPAWPQRPLSGKEWHRVDAERLAHLNSYPSPPPDTQLLVLTVESGYLDRAARHEELLEIDPQRIVPWDAGLPFNHGDLRKALIAESGVAGPGPDSEMASRDSGPTDIPGVLRIPYLFIDTGVRDGLDRRTFKDRDFWYGEEMTQLLSEYEELGGVVVIADETGDTR